MEDWLINQIENHQSKVYERIKPAVVRKLSVEWAVEAWKRIPEDVIYNAWRHKPFSYFPEEDTRPCDFDAEEEAYYGGDDELDPVSI